MPAAKGMNYYQLKSETKFQIVESFYSGNDVPTIIKEFKTTKRAVPEVLKEFKVNTSRRGRYTLNEDYFSTIDTEHKAYWLGLIAADGCITDTNYFAISLVDEDILKMLKNDLNFSGDVYIPKSKIGTYYRLNFSSKKLCDDLRRHGINPNKSLTYHEMPEIRHGLIRHFIRGYFDGDGCISRSYSTITHDHKKYKYLNYSANIIATDMFCCKLKSELYNEIGYECSITPNKTKGMSYIKIFDNKALSDFYWYIYHNADLFLTRKHSIWKEFMGILTA